MKRLRRTNNPMDRNTRNDLNYNWDVLDKTLSSIESSDHEINERFTEVHNELDDLKLKDKDLDQKIKDNRDTLDAMDADLILEMAQLAEQKGNTAKAQGNKTEEQGNTAKKQGDTAQSKGNKAQTQGNKAEEQGNYAEEQGKYAHEKAEYAAEKTSEIIEANADLKKVKLDTVEATNKANTAATKADTATENAEKATAISKVTTENAKEQAKFANEQGDYAKEQGDRVDELVTNSIHRGAWSSANNYKKFQEVIYEGSTYRAKKDHRDIKPPNTSVWQLVASKGMDGKGTVGSVNGKKPTADGNVDLGKIVNSVAGIVPDASGDIPLTIGDLSTDDYISPDTPPRDYPLGITTFRGNATQSKEWRDLVGEGIVNTRVLVVTYKASNVWQATQTIYLIDGFGNTGNTIQHRAIYVRSTMASTIEERNKWSDPVKVLSSHDLSDSTTSDSSDKAATSKAVKYLNDALIGTDDGLRQTQLDVKKAQETADQAFQLGDSAKKDVVSAIKVANFDSEITNESEWSAIANEIKTYNKVFDISLYIRENQKLDIPFLPKLIVPETDSDRRVLVSKVSDMQWKVHEENGNDLATILLVPKGLQVLYYKGKEFNIRVVGVAGLI